MPSPTAVTLFHDQTEATDGDRRKQREGWPAGGVSPPARKIADAISGRSTEDDAQASEPTAS